MLISLSDISWARTGLAATAPPAEMAEELPFEHQAPQKPEAQGVTYKTSNSSPWASPHRISKFYRVNDATPHLLGVFL